MMVDEAKKLGATALFFFFYGDTVRVVTMGVSVELCGGTHLDNTAKAGAFSIVSEFSVAAGIRRIEAITGIATLEAHNVARRHLNILSGMLKAGTPEELPGKLEQQLSAFRELRAKLDVAITKEISGEAKLMLKSAKDLGGLKVIAAVVENANADIDKLRQIEDMLRSWEPGIVAVLAIVKDDKVTLMAACGKKAVERGVKAGELIRETAKICGGSGGGKPDFAMGGGKDADKLQQALEAVDLYVMKKIGE
jgi:alanyl-tRNA synthetase